MVPKVVQVVPTEEHTVYVYFEDGKIVCYDVKPLLEKELFAVLREVENFKKNLYYNERHFSMGYI